MDIPETGLGSWAQWADRTTKYGGFSARIDGRFDSESAWAKLHAVHALGFITWQPGAAVGDTTHRMVKDSQAH